MFVVANKSERLRQRADVYHKVLGIPCARHMHTLFCKKQVLKLSHFDGQWHRDSVESTDSKAGVSKLVQQIGTQ